MATEPMSRRWRDAQGEHIDVRGHGAARPLVAGTSENARQENRRVALIVPAQ